MNSYYSFLANAGTPSVSSVSSVAIYRERCSRSVVGPSILSPCQSGVQLYNHTPTMFKLALAGILCVNIKTKVYSNTFRGGILSPLSTSFQGSTRYKIISIVALITVATVVLDFVIADFFERWSSQFSTGAGIATFAVISVVLYGVCQYFLIRYARSVTDTLKTGTMFSRLVSLTRIIQFFLLVILIIVVLEMVFVSSYHLSLLVFATGLGTIPGTAFYALLGKKMFSWYSINKKNLIVLFLGLAATTGAVAMSGNIVIMTIIVTEKPAIIEPQTEVDFDRLSESETLNVLFFALVRITAVISTMFQWAGIALILRHYSKRIGKIRYWIFVCLPAVALIVGIAPTLLGPAPSGPPVGEETLAFEIMAAIGASSIIFVWGIGYLSVSKSVRKVDPKSTVADYMTLTAYGIILTGFAFTAPVIYVTYPPFGLAAHSFLAVAAYLFSVGFYSSAISVSHDVKLRQSIRKIAFDGSRLVDSIGKADFVQETQKKVQAIAKAVTIETGVIPSLSDDDVDDYLKEVLDEIRSSREKKY
jgi:hypothetical protein